MAMELRISKQHPFITMDIRANEEREGMQAMQRREGCVADGERGRTCGWRERKDMGLIMVLIAGVVLIDTVLTLLLMIEPQPERKPTTAMAVVTPKQQSNTVLGVAVERGPSIATIMAMICIAGQQAT